MQKWEYEIGQHAMEGMRRQQKWVARIGPKTYKNVAGMLDHMGVQGYELVSVSTRINSHSSAMNPNMYTETTAEYFYFKRPRT